MLGLLNTVLSKGNTLLTYVKDGLVMANRFLTPPKLTFPVDASAEFNGTSDFIQTNNAFSHTKHTIAAWVYFDDTSDNTIFDNRDANNDGIRLVGSSGNLLYQLNNSDVTISIPSVDNWYFISAAYNGTTQMLYLNGSLKSSSATSQAISVSTYDSNIGRSTYSTNGYFFNGNLANVAIWNRALSSDEINSVMWKSYDALATTEKSGLQAWYSLEESELLSGTSTPTLTTYANANGLTFEAPACVQTALNGLPDITDARLYSANYDIRVSADGGNVESLSCVETELNAIL